MKEDISRLIGETRIIFALKKHESIKEYVVKNRALSRGTTQSEEKTEREPSSQACGGKGCKTCQLVFNPGEKVMINGKEVFLDKGLTCRD